MQIYIYIVSYLALLTPTKQISCIMVGPRGIQINLKFLESNIFFFLDYKHLCVWHLGGSGEI
jgi:hypothetical protein